MPGKTVLRRISSCPGRTWSSSWFIDAVELADRRIEVFIDRRADGDDDGGRVFEHGGIGGGLDAAVARLHSASRASASSSWNGIRPLLTRATRSGDVSSRSTWIALAGEGQAERQADMPAAADDGQRAGRERVGAA